MKSILRGLCFVLAVAAGHGQAATYPFKSEGTITIEIPEAPPPGGGVAVPPAVYMAPDGDDAAAGTLTAPFATLPRCQSAMRGDGRPKTCIVLPGIYAPAPQSASARGCNNNETPANILRIGHEYGDDGTTYRSLPGREGSAIFDGGAWSAETGIPTALCLYRVKGVRIQGLVFRRFRKEVIMVANWEADDGWGTDNQIIDNAVYASNFIAYGNPAIGFSGWVQRSAAIGNVVMNTQGQGIGAYTAQSHTKDGISHLRIIGNILINTCTVLPDCGAIYIQDWQEPLSIDILVAANWIYRVSYGVNAPNVAGNALYLDDGTSNTRIVDNVVIAGGSHLHTALFIHGGSNNLFDRNIVDLGDGNAAIAGYQSTTIAGKTWPMVGNVFEGTLVACSTSGRCGKGWMRLDNPPTEATIRNTGYFNYGTGGAVNQDSTIGQPQGDHYGELGVRCWQPAIPGRAIAARSLIGAISAPPGPPPSWPAACADFGG